MIGTTFFFGWEITVIVFLQTYLSSFVPIIAPISYLGDQYVIMIVIGFLYWCYDKKAGKSIALVLSLGFLINAISKNLVLRRRPYFDNESVKCLQPAESEFAANDLLGQGFSFPSLHGTNITVTMGYLSYYIRKNWIYVLSILLILAVSLSRIILGVHYPTDLIGGILIGIAVLIIFYIIQSKIKNQNIIYLIFIIIGLAGLFFCTSADYFRSLGILIGMIVGFIIEEHYVNFDNTKNIKRMIIRLIGGLLIFAILLTFFKLIFPAGTDITALLFRALRYAISLIVGLGLYPLLFNKFDKYFTK